MKHQSRIMTRGDQIVVVIAMIFVLSLYGVYWRPATAGTVIEYRTPDENGRLYLDHEQEITLHGSEGTSHIRIQDGAVRFTASPCRNKTCIHSGWLRHNGDFAACLPNQVALLVRNPKDQPLDAINY